MHIHGGNLNPNASLQGSHRAQATLAARRGDDTRKKLSGAAEEIDALASNDSAWMISAWASNGRPSSNSQDSTEALAETATAERTPRSANSLSREEADRVSARKEVKEIPAPGAVSFWA